MGNTSGMKKSERVLIYLVTVFIAGLVGYIFLKTDKSVEENSLRLHNLSERVSKLEGCIGILTKSGGTSGKVSSTELGLPLIEKEGIKFKVIMASGIDKENDPLDFREKFSAQKDNKMYVFVYWPGLVGDHNVTVKWIMPNKQLFNINIYDTTFKTPDWRTWHFQKIFSNMPKGQWFFELYLDGQLLSTKNFSVTH